MFAEQRMEIIKQILEKQKHANIASLSLALKVSDVTVRKYLDILEQQGVLVKVHGGAIWAEDKELYACAVPEGAYDAKLDAIADLAATLVEDGDSLYIGLGATCTAFARKLVGKSNLSVMTNNFRAMNYLAGKVVNLSFIGGEVGVLPDGSTYTFGSKTGAFLEDVAIEKAFISCSGIDVEAGFTASTLPLNDLIKQIMCISRSLHVLAMSHKFGKVAMYRICEMNVPKAIVTDTGVGDVYKQYCYDHGVKLLTAYVNL